MVSGHPRSRKSTLELIYIDCEKQYVYSRTDLYVNEFAFFAAPRVGSVVAELAFHSCGTWFLRTWFLIDLVTLIPFELFSFAFPGAALEDCPKFHRNSA